MWAYCYCMHFDNKVVVHTDIPMQRGASYTIVAKRLDGWRRHLVRKYRPLCRPHCIRRVAGTPRKGHSTPTFRPMSIVATVAHLSNCWALVVIFWAYCGQNLVAMATSLRPLRSVLSSLYWLTTETPVISKIILVISRRNSFICIYINFSPRVGCHGNAHLTRVYGIVTDEFPDSTNPMSKPICAWMWRIQLKVWPFCDIFDYCGEKLVAMATSIRPFLSKMSSLGWPIGITPCYK